MFKIIILIATCIFIVLLVINLFFRVKLLKIYNRLVEGKVDFPPSYILKREKLKAEIVPKYPKYEKDILSLNRLLQTSIYVGFSVFVISLFIGYQYIKNR